MKNSPPLQIQCFGGFHVNLGDEPITAFNTDKVRALLIYLVSEPGEMFQRSHLAGLLWSDIPEDQALHNLRQAISLLRKAIRETDQTIIYADREQVGIQKNAHIRVDFLEFLSCIKNAFRFHKNQNGLGLINIVSLRKAVELYNNPFLDRYHLNVSPLFDEWLLLTREKYDALAVEGLAFLAEYYQRRNEITNAVQMLRKIIHIMPWDEGAHYQLISLMAQEGQWSAAQKQYATLIQYLKNDLNVSPDPKTLALYEQVRTRSLSWNFIESKVKPLSNLPLLNSAFIGRYIELETLSELIANPIKRLVNILGLGGIGKTRLAMEIAFLQVGIFHHGVFMVSLRNVDTFDGFLSAIGEGLQIKFTDQTPKEQQVLDFCRQKQLLLFLDNVDDLAADRQVQTLLTNIVENCKQVKILSTSRNKWKMEEENIFQLDGLNIEATNLKDGRGFRFSDAELLFEQRMQISHGNFKISQENQNTIVKLCKLVEGHPLAIELMAGSVSGNVQQRIEETIEQGVGAFVSALSNSQQHHKNLTTVFEMSWQRLSLQEKSDLTKLANFRGGFEEQIAWDIYQIDAHRLNSLINKSLVRVNLKGRYDLHEMVRQFAEIKSKQTDEWESEMNAFANYFFKVLDEQAICFKGGEQSSCLDYIERELDNFNVAWNWILHTEQFSMLTNAVDMLYQFFSIRSRFIQGIDWLEGLKLQIENQKDFQLLYAKVLNRIGSLSYKSRQNEKASKYLSSSYDLLEKLDDKHELAYCLIGMGSIELRRKNYQKALDQATQSLHLYQEVQDSSGESYAAYLQGLILNRMASYDQAEVVLQHSLSLAKVIKNKRRMVAPLNLLGDIACIRGEYKKAELIFQEGLEIASHLGDLFNQAVLLNNLATVSHYSQDYARERKILLDSLAICEEIGDQDGIAIAFNNLSEVNMVEGDFEQAIQYAEKGLMIGRQIGEEWTIIVSLNNLGEAYTKLNQFDKAWGFLTQAICMAFDIEAMDIVARIAVNCGVLLFQQGKKLEAIDWLLAAISHSAIEFDHKQIAIHFLEENLIEYELLFDNERLERITAALCCKNK